MYTNRIAMPMEISLATVLVVLAIINGLNSLPTFVRNISDCSVTDDGILHYRGKYAFSKFDHECLPWTDFQTSDAQIVNEANFFGDESVKEAKNYCRNPNFNINGPWCFVQNEDSITMEECDVCRSLAPVTTFPTDIAAIDDVGGDSGSFFGNLRDELRRYGAFIKQKILEMVERMKIKVNRIRSNIAEHFNRNRF